MSEGVFKEEIKMSSFLLTIHGHQGQFIELQHRVNYSSCLTPILSPRFSEKM